MKLIMKNNWILLGICLLVTSIGFGQTDTTSNLTPDKAYINQDSDTCFCWCGEKLNGVTEYKVKAEGCDSLQTLKDIALDNCKAKNGVQEAENSELRASGKVKDETIKGLHQDVADEKKKTKGVAILGVVCTILALIL